MKRLIKKILPKAIILQYRYFNIKRKFRGNQVKCVICHSEFKIFGDYGVVKRTNAKCHNCGSLERHRLLQLYLSETSIIPKEPKHSFRLLHFAPERFFYKKFDSQENIVYTPCDISPESYKYQGNSEITRVDITDIPFENNSFDFILCNHVLEHIPDDYQAISELYRVMAEGGEGIFQVPMRYTESTYEDWSITSPEGRERAFGQHDHVRWYGQDYKQRLERAGFKVNVVDFISKFSEDDIFKYGLDRTELIYHCKK